MKRKVTGTFLLPNEAPMVGMLGSFTINKLTHDAINFYSSEPIYFWTDNQGRIVPNHPDTIPLGYVQPLGVDLVCTNTLDIPVVYTCIIKNGYFFDFLLPTGTTAVQLQDLETATITPDDYRYTSILSYVDTLVGTSLVGVIAGKNKKLVSETYTAQNTLSALRTVILPNQVYADCRNISHLNTTKGISEQSTTTGINFNLIIAGSVFDAGWNWTPNQPIFLGYDGYLRQYLESDAVFVQQIATATTPQEIFVSFKEPIKL